MQILTKEELLKIDGGAFTASMLSAIVRGVSVITDLGRCVGTAIRRISSGNLC